jgi:predicted nucleic acid-binding protein
VFTCLEARRGNVRLFAPRLFLAELSGVLVRFLPPPVAGITDRLEAEVAAIGVDLYFFREPVEAALKTGSRGAGSYCIGLAMVLGAVLATSDRVQAVNARRAGRPTTSPRRSTGSLGA